MCLTCSTSTAYCTPDRQLRSVCTTTLATLRWTNTSPGAMSMIWLAGTRESEQPIHRYSGACCCESWAKNSGFSAQMRSDQALLRWISSARVWGMGACSLVGGGWSGSVLAAGGQPGRHQRGDLRTAFARLAAQAGDGAADVGGRMVLVELEFQLDPGRQEAEADD